MIEGKGLPGDAGPAFMYAYINVGSHRVTLYPLSLGGIAPGEGPTFLHACKKVGSPVVDSQDKGEDYE